MDHTEGQGVQRTLEPHKWEQRMSQPGVRMQGHKPELGCKWVLHK